MKVGLIDVDGHNYPNLALMKLSAWHKTQGDTVEWYSVFAEHYDVVYKSKVFSFTPDYKIVITNADKVHARPIYTDLQRWCNNRFIFGRCPNFEDYGKQSEIINDKQLKLTL